MPRADRPPARWAPCRGRSGCTRRPSVSTPASAHSARSADVGAGAIGARQERPSPRSQGGECLDGRHPIEKRGKRRWPDEEEPALHDNTVPDGMTLGDESLLEGRRMGDQHIGRAPPPEFQHSGRGLGDNTDLGARILGLVHGDDDASSSPESTTLVPAATTTRSPPPQPATTSPRTADARPRRITEPRPARRSP